MVKNLPAMQETWARSLDQEDPLEKGMATHFSILAWKIPWTEEPCRLQFVESQRVRHDLATHTVLFHCPLFLTMWNHFCRIGILSSFSATHWWIFWVWNILYGTVLIYINSIFW